MAEALLKKPNINITINKNLQTLGNSLSQHIRETITPPTGYVIYVGKMKETDEQVDFFHFQWAYSFIDVQSAYIMTKELLTDVNYSNNLNQFIDCQDGFKTSIELIFPLLECIRVHYNSPKVIFYNDIDTKIYLKL